MKEEPVLTVYRGNMVREYNYGARDQHLSNLTLQRGHIILALQTPDLYPTQYMTIFA